MTETEINAIAGIVVRRLELSLGKRIDGIAADINALKITVAVNNEWRASFVQRCAVTHDEIDTNLNRLNNFREVHQREHSYEKGLSARSAARWALVGTVISAPVTVTLFLVVIQVLGLQT